VSNAAGPEGGALDTNFQWTRASFCIQRKFLFRFVYTSTHTDHLYGLSQLRNLFRHLEVLQGDQKVSVQLMITIQKVTSNVQSVPGFSPDIY
jgi:hypothetical protein